MLITFYFNPFAEESAMFIPQGKTLKELHDEQRGRVHEIIVGGGAFRPHRPEDFGAIGDGIHDDTAAIQAWIKAGGGEMGAGKVYRTQAWLTEGPIMDSDKPGILAHKVVTEPVPVPVDTRKPALAGLGCVADIDHRPGAWK